MKVQETQTTAKPVKGKSAFKDPSELERLIERVNYFPPENVALPSGRQVLEKLFNERTGLILSETDIYAEDIYSMYKELTVEAWEIVRKKIKAFPKVITYIENSHFGSYFFIDFYDEFLLQRKRLRQFAAMTTRFANTYSKEYASMSFSKYTYDSEYTLYFSIKDYKLSFRTDSVIDILQNVDARRLKICEVCSRIFWAARKDSKTDSVKCFRALKKRNSRKRKKANSL